MVYYHGHRGNLKVLSDFILKCRVSPMPLGHYILPDVQVEPAGPGNQSNHSAVGVRNMVNHPRHRSVHPLLRGTNPPGYLNAVWPDFVVPRHGLRIGLPG